MKHAALIISKVPDDPKAVVGDVTGYLEDMILQLINLARAHRLDDLVQLLEPAYYEASINRLHPDLTVERLEDLQQRGEWTPTKRHDVGDFI